MRVRAYRCWAAAGAAKRIVVVAMLAFLLTGTCAGVLLHIFGAVAVASGTVFSDVPLPGISEPGTISDERNNIEVYRAISPGVVLISTKGEHGGFLDEPGEQSGTGSGVVIDKDGHILTNEHVVRSAGSLTVNLGGDRVYPARLIGSDPDTDLAVIKIDAPADRLTVVPVGDSEALTVGQKVLAIGNPFGLDRTLTTGVISGLGRPIRSRNGRLIEGAIQTDASINPGNSGGPLLDARGRMIGVNSQILSPSGASNGIGFAIPVSVVKLVVPELIQNGHIRRPRLGVGTKSVEELTQQGIVLPIGSGLLVLTVEPGGAAERAGLRETTQGYDGRVALGDIITAVEGQPVNGVDDLYRALANHQVGDTVRLEVYRDGRRANVHVTLSARQSAEDEQQLRQPFVKRQRAQSKY